MNIRDMIIACAASFGIVAVLGPFVIPALRRMKASQTEREELKSHQSKTGTPTMGGVMILSGVLLTSLIFSFIYPAIIPVMILTLGFGIIGFIDDYLKVVKRKSDGLLPRQKMLLEIVVVTIFLIIVIFKYGTGMFTNVMIPFLGQSVYIGAFGYFLLYFAVLGTVNGVNFTDGLDGLVSCVTIPVAVFFGVVSMMLGAGIETICAAVIGALLGFLIYNHHPAKVFMGDTGSLALGGFVSAAGYMTGTVVFILIVGFIYFIEVLSVIIQVSYFKKTGGKRVFRMAPIHHHFELGGWSEVKVVVVFTVCSIGLCALGYLAFIIGRV